MKNIIQTILLISVCNFCNAQNEIYQLVTQSRKSLKRENYELKKNELHYSLFKEGEFQRDTSIVLGGEKIACSYSYSIIYKHKPNENIQYKLNSDQVLDFYSRDSFNSMDQVVLNETKYPLMGDSQSDKFTRIFYNAANQITQLENSKCGNCSNDLDCEMKYYENGYIESIDLKTNIISTLIQSTKEENQIKYVATIILGEEFKEMQNMLGKADENEAGVKIKTKQVLHIGIQNNPDTIISYLFENENSSFYKTYFALLTKVGDVLEEISFNQNGDILKHITIKYNESNQIIERKNVLSDQRFTNTFDGSKPLIEFNDDGSYKKFIYEKNLCNGYYSYSAATNEIQEIVIYEN
ncbi:MAG TPA: hypothetical protein PK622_10905 [Saprospiraceae bacterium]|nr:hypothetical protein [Saprospiraceae bacterium]